MIFILLIISNINKIFLVQKMITYIKHSKTLGKHKLIIKGQRVVVVEMLVELNHNQLEINILDRIQERKEIQAQLREMHRVESNLYLS